LDDSREHQTSVRRRLSVWAKLERQSGPFRDARAPSVIGREGWPHPAALEQHLPGKQRAV
jgi:hypothetical protein